MNSLKIPLTYFAFAPSDKVSEYFSQMFPEMSNFGSLPGYPGVYYLLNILCGSRKQASSPVRRSLNPV
jgi:hypothetical protein